ncbi:hypothetical protein [Octadecabacter ascidiaceicola]|uniref:Uncharacterized protein n=1 Tax=Octadecabacter ascidiaceicola TaxID=1655543 RepID=A0A238KC77_9RHOB|nr:hypothetical protein [Octadecabacter ascidiaceicola]SMX39802.1 hypothetical protein OCA8868_02139 [Octadecabacter ascidiaceicola]
MRLVSLIAATFLASPLAAQTAFPCNWQARADNIVEPWEDNIATFANGAVRVALLDTIEPAAAAYYLLVLHPPLDEMAGRSCTTVGLDDGLGYAGMFFSELDASYDPATGLTLQIPAVIYLPEQSFQNAVLLSIAINQSTGDVTVSQELAE